MFEDVITVFVRVGSRINLEKSERVPKAIEKAFERRYQPIIGLATGKILAEIVRKLNLNVY